MESAANYWSGTIEKFKGAPGEDVVHWIDQFESATRELSERLKMAEFKKAMVDEARAWFNREFDADKRRKKETTCRRWCDRLREEFKIEMHQLDKLEAECKQAFGQSARDYVVRKVELIDKAHGPYDPARKIRRLMEGVHKHYQMSMKGHIPGIIRNSSAENMIKVFIETLEEQMTIYDNLPYGQNVFFAQQEEQQTRRVAEEEQSANVATVSTTSGGATAGNDGKQGHDAAMEDITRRVTTVMNATFPGGNPYPTGGQYRSNRRVAGPDECLKCFSTEHKYADCPQNWRNSQQQQYGGFQRGTSRPQRPYMQFRNQQYQPPAQYQQFQQQPQYFQQQPQFPTFQPQQQQLPAPAQQYAVLPPSQPPLSLAAPPPAPPQQSGNARPS